MARWKYSAATWTLLLLVLTACGSSVSSTPDVVFVNGRIATMDGAGSRVEALAVLNGRILALGSSAEIRNIAGSNTRVVDLGGRTVLPGLYDNHVHLRTGSDPSIQSWTHITSAEELLLAVAHEVGHLGPGDWLQASLSTEGLPEQVLPRRADLDRVAPNNPVALQRGHVWIVNSAALGLAGINRNTPSPSGGSIDRDAQGEPDGIIRETPAQRLIAEAIPVWNPDPETARAALRASLLQFPPLGITSVNVAGVRPEYIGLLQDVYERWGNELPRTTVQVRISPGFDIYDDPRIGIEQELAYVEGFRFRTGMGDDMLKLGAIKMSIDGGMTGQAAWTRAPYRDRPDWQGVVRIPEDVLYAVGKRAHDLGWQLGIHAIGDAAVEQAVRVIDRILEEAPRDDHRHYIHHWTVQPSEETIRTAARRNIIVATQPNFTHALAPYYSNALEGDRLASNNPSASLIRAGVRLSYGSDGLPHGPFIGIYAAVTRRGIDGVQYGAEEAVDLDTAIRLYTMGSAFMTFDEAHRGTLEPGKLADFSVIDKDIFSVDPSEVLGIEAVATVVGGQVIWSADGFGGS
jgi:predicted amidohydrolase YtcJ